MSITKGQFRWLVTAYLMTGIISVVASSVGESSLPASLKDYVVSQTESDITVYDFVAIPIIISFFVYIIGLYRLWWFARPLMLITSITGLFYEAFSKPYVYTGIDSSFSSLSFVLEGIILAVIYITPARVWFEKTHDTDSVTHQAEPEVRVA